MNLKNSAWLLLATASVVQADLISFEPVSAPVSLLGEAYSLDGDELLYTEYHYYYGNDDQHRVIYKRQSGAQIAEKDITYDADTERPKFRQLNTLCGELIDIEKQKNGKELAITYRAEVDSKVKTKAIDVPNNLVVDTGFNFYIENKWDRLVKGERLTFEYLAPSRLGTVEFRAELEDCPADTQSATDKICFSIAPDSWIIRRLIDPIILTYRKDNRQLLRFRGLGNIADEDGDYMKVDIRYSYPLEQVSTQ